MDNPGKFTLVVASFRGRSLTQSAGKETSSFKVTDSLFDAAGRAWYVAKMLRDGSFQKGSQQAGRSFEAYIYHTRYESFVTVGSFATPDDPRIDQLSKLFGAKTQVAQNGGPFTTGESIMIPGDPPETIVFDPSPRVIPIPTIR